MHICVLDTETTGLKPDYHEIIEIATIVCDDSLTKIDEVCFRVKPLNIERASKKALEINGYDARTWRPHFPHIGEALKEFNKFILNTVDNPSEVAVAGQNISFDLAFLKEAYKNNDLTYPFSGKIELMDIAKEWSRKNKVKMPRYSLSYFNELTGIVNENPHCAKDDVETTLKIMKWFLNRIKG